MADDTLKRMPQADDWVLERSGRSDPGEFGLCIAWSLAQPRRIGEVARIDGYGVLGRGADKATVSFGCDRPSGWVAGGPLQGQMLSRKQLEVEPADGGLALFNQGTAPMRVNGVDVTEALVEPGDVVDIKHQIVFVVVGQERPVRGEVDHPFGQPDRHGFVGEGPAMWKVRNQLRKAADAAGPVLIQGPSGTGKELAASALHALSDRAGAVFVARNAATLPEGLVDAELFGSAANYPGSGMPERPGLIAAADGGTLFLDEVGEMPHATQAHLLRVLDAGGTYHRLGEHRERRSDFRFVSATNRRLDDLKHDLAARFTVRLAMPGLNERREDIPLIARRILEDMARTTEGARRFVADGDFRISPRLISALLRHRFDTHVRELRTLLWTAVSTSPGRSVTLTDEVQALLRVPEPKRIHTPSIDEAAIREALDEAEGNVTRAASLLGLSSRYALYRRMKKLGMKA